MEYIARLVTGPIELFLDMAGTLLLRVTRNQGGTILCLSLLVSMMTIPLFRRKDAAVTESRRGRITRAILLAALQACVLIASVRYYGSLKSIRGAGFLFLQDLGQPDGLLRTGGTAIHALPLLAGALHLAAGLVRTRKMPVWHRVCCAAASVLAAVILYGRPSGLALFWTGHGAAALAIRLAGAGYPEKELNPRQRKTDRSNRLLLVLCCIYMALFTGLVIPSEVLKSSPAEFVDSHYYMNPDRYLVSSGLLGAGTFILWALVYGFLLTPRARKRYSLGMAVLVLVSALDYMFFGGTYGIISSALQYETAITNNPGIQIVNGLCVAATALAVWLLKKKWPAILRAVCLYGCVALAVLSVINLGSLESKTKEIRTATSQITGEKATIRLDKKGKNVVVIMLDRTINGFVPFFMNEKPELLRQFDGFTYYPNTLSYGYHTNIAAPALFGGYEYTPDNLEKRADLLLKDKHNEALKIMPLNFLENGYEVTVCDPPYANYQWIPDLSIFDGYPEIRTYNTIGMFDEYRTQMMVGLDRNRNRNLFCYSLFRAAPLALQRTLYDGGYYLEMDAELDDGEAFRLFGVSADFLNSYMVMESLPEITEVTDRGTNTFMMLTNEMTHNVIELQEPDYVPKKKVDNTAYEAEHSVRRTADGRELDMGACSELVKIHYHSDMSAFILLGKWFDELRALGVYDNTRIIIVSDHGCYLGLFGVNLMEKYDDLPVVPGYSVEQWTDTMCYNPVLMVKDFGATGFTTDNTFMTNADTPSLAFEDLIPDPVNPFTGNPVNRDAKAEPEQHLVESAWALELNNGYTFSNPVHITFRGDDIFDPDNWFVEK